VFKTSKAFGTIPAGNRLRLSSIVRTIDFYACSITNFLLLLGEWHCLAIYQRFVPQMGTWRRDGDSSPTAGVCGDPAFLRQ
jgi:hypothetical protein